MISFRRVIVGYALACLAVIAIEWTAGRLVPRDAFFHYYSIEPASRVVPGSPVYFRSVLRVTIPVDFDYVDTLYCDVSDGLGWRYWSQQTSRVENAEVRTAQSPAIWLYSADTPDVPYRCYLRSAVSAVLKYGETKTQVLKSDPFRSADPPDHIGY